MMKLTQYFFIHEKLRFPATVRNTIAVYIFPTSRLTFFLNSVDLDPTICNYGCQLQVYKLLKKLGALSKLRFDRKNSAQIKRTQTLRFPATPVA